MIIFYYFLALKRLYTLTMHQSDRCRYMFQLQPEQLFD